MRLEALEDERGISRREPLMSEEQRKRQWLENARHRKRFDIDHKEPRMTLHARDVLRTLRRQGRLGHTTEEVIDQASAWRPPIDRAAIERELSRLIYGQEPAFEDMVCPPEWREAFEAAEELRERYAAVPDEVLARWAIRQHDLEEGGPELEEVEQEIATEGGEEYGITDELMWKAVGPDAEEIPDEERQRRLMEILVDSFYGEQGWRVQQEIYRLMEERSVDKHD
jgi:hypothetical protein